MNEKRKSVDFRNLKDLVKCSQYRPKQSGTRAGSQTSVHSKDINKRTSSIQTKFIIIPKLKAAQENLSPNVNLGISLLRGRVNVNFSLEKSHFVYLILPESGVKYNV